MLKIKKISLMSKPIKIFKGFRKKVSEIFLSLQKVARWQVLLILTSKFQPKVFLWDLLRTGGRGWGDLEDIFSSVPQCSVLFLTQPAHPAPSSAPLREPFLRLTGNPHTWAGPPGSRQVALVSRGKWNGSWRFLPGLTSCSNNHSFLFHSHFDFACFNRPPSTTGAQLSSLSSAQLLPCKYLEVWNDLFSNVPYLSPKD